MKAYIVEKDALAHNIRVLLARAGDAAVYGVIKGGGYGLGLIPMAEILWDNGVRRFAVTEVHEAQDLRAHGFPDAEILMMRETGLEDELRALIACRAVVTVGCPETAAAAAHVAEELGVSCACHVKIDTGMGRYGFQPEDLDGAAAVYAMPRLDVRGIYTHFFSAYDDERATRAQFASFTRVCDALSARGIDPGLRHCCNSSAFWKYPEMHLDGVRLGSAVLGRLSFSGVSELRRVGWCESKVDVVRTVPKGHSVGYGAGWTARRDTVTAVCGVGYFHGFGPPARNDLTRLRDCIGGALSYVKSFLTQRSLTVTVNGQEARVLGHVGMVQTIFDVTDIPCRPGDPVRIEIKPLEVKGMEIVFR